MKRKNKVCGFTCRIGTNSNAAYVGDELNKRINLLKPTGNFTYHQV